jgi:hypothetical protein
MLLGAGHFCKTPFGQSFLRYKAFKMARIHIIIPLNTTEGDTYSVTVIDRN